MLKLCVRIEGEYLSKEQTLLKLLDGCNLLSIQLIPSSSKVRKRKIFIILFLLFNSQKAGFYQMQHF